MPKPKNIHGYKQLSSRANRKMIMLAMIHQNDPWWREDDPEDGGSQPFNVVGLTTLTDVGVVIAYTYQEDWDSEEYDETPVKPTIYRHNGEWCTTSELRTWAPPDP